jgi:CelD/BcsL family acetyltransferase involved in cellulose biosynthesis
MKGWILDPLRLDSDLVAQWNRLRAASRIYDSPFYAPGFTRAVAQARGDARVAVFERGGDVVGFLPFHQVRGGTGKPIGGHINDYQGPIMAPEIEFSSTEMLNAAGISAYDFNHLPVALSNHGVGAHGYSFSMQMDLSQGYKACIERKGDSWTRAQATMQRKWRKTEREIGPIRFSCNDPSEDAFRTHVAMRNVLYAKVGGRQDFGKGWIGSVLEAIRNSEDPDLTGVMSTLYAGDRLLAAHFGMISRGVLHWWFPSYNLAAGKFSPGIALLNQCAREAGNYGVTAIDFGRGDDRYKLLFGDHRIELCEGSITRTDSLAGKLRRASRLFVSLAERLPLGPFESYPRRAAARLVDGVNLP